MPVTLQIESPDHTDDLTFSFAGALEEGYFSDLVIKASNGKEVRVIRLTLYATAHGSLKSVSLILC